jgi:hypothetical protein
MKCPKCKKQLEKKNYCSYCGLFVCPHCNFGQENSFAWYEAVLGLIFLPFLLIMAWFISPAELPFFSKKCMRCGERYNT